MRTLLALLAGLAAGFALGYLSRGDAEKARISRSAATAAVAAETRRPSAPPAPPAPEKVPRAPAAKEEPPSVANGTLEIRSDGVPRGQLSLWGRDPGGTFRSRPIVHGSVPHGDDWACERVALPPGEHGVEWISRDGAERRVWRVRIEPGRTTLLSLADPASPEDPTLEAGMGLLVVKVPETPGASIEGLSGEVLGSWLGSRRAIGFELNAAGFARIRLLAGSYDVGIAGELRPATVRAGSETVLTVALEGPRGGLRVRRGIADDAWFALLDPVSGRRHSEIEDGRFALVPEGEYQLLVESFEDREPRFVARVQVPRGATAFYDWAPPTGALRVEVRCGGETPELLRLEMAGPPAAGLPEDYQASFTRWRPAPDGDWVAESLVRWLPPGRYRVRVAPEWGESLEAEAEVDVGSREASLRFELPGK